MDTVIEDDFLYTEILYVWKNKNMDLCTVTFFPNQDIYIPLKIKYHNLSFLLNVIPEYLFHLFSKCVHITEQP